MNASASLYLLKTTLMSTSFKLWLTAELLNAWPGLKGR